jgi:hypothetical protein
MTGEIKGGMMGGMKIPRFFCLEAFRKMDGRDEALCKD